MQVSFDTKANTKSFGKFYGPALKRVRNVFGTDFYNEYKQILPMLNELGKKADIYLKVRGYTGVESCDGFRIKVTKVTKSWLKRFLGLYNGEKVLKCDVTIADECSHKKSLPTIILDKAKHFVKQIK